jgi:hypothetical protein
MNLLGLSATNKPSYRRCAFERDRAEQKTREYGCDMRLFGGGLDGESESGLPVGSIGGKRMSSLFSRVSPITNPAVTRSLLRGQNRRPAARRVLLFLDSSPKLEYAWVPAPENAPLALGSRPHSLGFAGCDPSKIGNSKTEIHHVPEQSNPHGLPRQ